MGFDPTDRCGTLRLADGRRLQFSQTGPLMGAPVVYCHGAIGTPVEAAIDLEAIADEVGVRYIAISRPGVGGSDAAPGRTVVEFAADVRQLADALGLDRFTVVGVSAGGPYALGIAHALPDRVDRAAVCSSLSPLCAPHRTPGMQWRIRLALGLLARAPGLFAAVGDLGLPVVRRHPALLSRVFAAHAPPDERERWHQDERAAASTSFLDAAAGGVRGMIDDYLTYACDWGFSAKDVQPEVHLWHGLRDPLVPAEHALQLAITLPYCRVFLDPDEGHHFFRRRLPEILGLLIGRSRSAGEGLATSLADVRALADARGRKSEARRRAAR
jgi:pimeloyl-ACP methyl ester carboxylesterase